MIDKVDFLHVDKHKSLLQIDGMILMGMVLSIPRVPKIANMQCLYIISKKEVKDDVDFLHAEKVYFKSAGIKVSYKVDIINGHDQAFSNYSK